MDFETMRFLFLLAIFLVGLPIAIYERRARQHDDGESYKPKVERRADESDKHKP